MDRAELNQRRTEIIDTLAQTKAAIIQEKARYRAAMATLELTKIELGRELTSIHSQLRDAPLTVRPAAAPVGFESPKPGAGLVQKVVRFYRDPVLNGHRAEYHARMALARTPEQRNVCDEAIEAAINESLARHGLTAIDRQRVEEDAPGELEAALAAAGSRPPPIAPAGAPAAEVPASSPTSPPSPAAAAPAPPAGPVVAKPRYRSPVMRPTRDVDGEDGIGE